MSMDKLIPLLGVSCLGLVVIGMGAAVVGFMTVGIVMTILAVCCSTALFICIFIDILMG